MSKNTYTQSEFNNLIKMFNSLNYKDEMSVILDTLLTMILRGFSLTPNLYDDEAERFKSRYNEAERKLYSEMMREIFIIYDKRLNSGYSWADIFGDFYMEISSNNKQSSLGQFFTPEPVVDAIIRSYINADMEGQGNKISDPACGSGRFLIAAHAYSPGNYCYGEDIDTICAKMTAVNMMIHGCEGEVVCHNALLISPDNYRFGFKINPNIRKCGFPHIMAMDAEDSLVMQIGKDILKTKFNTKSAETGTTILRKVKAGKPDQLILF